MTTRSFPSVNSAPKRKIVDEDSSPAMKKRKLMTKAAFNRTFKRGHGGGITDSHGESWFRDRMIGKGGSGAVYLAKSKIPITRDSKFPAVMAVKSAPLANSCSIQLERKVLSVLNRSLNLVYCYGEEITETSSGEKVYNLMTEYCAGGTLHDHINRSENGLPEAEVITYARHIARGLDYMHCNGFGHCDIKPSNILLVPKEEFPWTTADVGDYVAKIADFGLTLMLFEGDDDCTGIRGTPEYLAPEMIREEEIDWPVDIWSFGCTVLEMLTGELAWGPEILEKSREEMINYIGYSYKTPVIPSHLSETAKDFLSKCLSDGYGYERWTASMLLRHPWLSQQPNPKTLPATADARR